MQIFITPLPGRDMPPFPKYRKDFTLYGALGRLHSDARKRGVTYTMIELERDRAFGYILAPEADEREDSSPDSEHILGTYLVI